MNTKNYQGYYSAKQAEVAGSTFWKTPSGEEVEVTQVNEGPYTALWDDVVHKGPVVKFARLSKPSKAQNYRIESIPQSDP